MPAPIGHTCPDIDKLIQYIRDFTDQEEAPTQKEINYVVDKLEDLRNNNSRLRDWGENLESELYEREKEITKYCDEVDEQKSTISDLQKELSDLTHENELLEADLEKLKLTNH